MEAGKDDLVCTVLDVQTKGFEFRSSEPWVQWFKPVIPVFGLKRQKDPVVSFAGFPVPFEHTHTCTYIHCKQ